MSGSTIGGIAGAAIGFVVSGFNPAGARWGYFAGSIIGGYVDPAQIEGPRLTDAQTQLSNEGVPRPIIYGTACVAGNIIQVGPLVEHKKTQRAGKGGPEQTTYTYTRTVAIRICEAAPNGGTMRLVRVWKDDKLVADFSEANTIPADTAAFESILTFYTGAEDQLPDPSLEALPTENGGGVGNVPAYRGTCYAVLTDLDVTERGGAVPQFRWEVCSDATESGLPGPTIGAQTATATLGGSTTCAYIGYAGVAFGSSSENLAVGGTITTGFYDDDLNLAGSSTYSNAGDLPTYPDFRVSMRAYSGAWGITAQGNFGLCGLLWNGSFKADLRPTAGWPQGWWYAEGRYYPEYGGLIWFHGSSVYIGVRKTNNTTHNKIYRWPLRDAGGAVVAADATSPPVTTGTRFFVHMDRGGTMRAIALSEAELVTYNADLSEESRISLPMSLSSLRAFAVDSGMLILLRGSTLYFYDLDTFTLQQTIALTGSTSSVNNQIICSDDSIFVRSGVNLKRVAYAPSCYTAAPEGWYALPDTPNAFTNGVDVMPRCGSPVTTVTPGSVALADIVSDLCGRAGIAEDQVDVTALAGITVRGFPVARQTSAAEAIRALQQVFLFDFPEWGNGGEVQTKLRAVLRGGATVLALTDDDLVDTDEDDETRGQQVEFPRKLSVTASDPEANYEPVTEAAERESENIKAVGEQQVSTAVVLTRDEIKQLADKLLKVLWEQATGRKKIEVPEEFSIYTPSDRLTYGGKTYRIDRVELLDGSSKWDLTRDRAGAYTSSATGGTPLTPTPPVSSIRGPTMFAAMNLPRLRSQDTTPGMYIAVSGILPGWAGCDLYLSTDDGVTEQLVATLLDASTMGTLSADLAEEGTTLSVSLYDGELDSATVDQLLARHNAAAVTTEGVSEIVQFQTATETDTKAYDLTDLSRGVLGTTPDDHVEGDSFVALDAVTFLPLDIALAGKTLIFRPVSRGTVPANNATYSVQFKPQFTGPQVVEAYTDDEGNVYTDDDGNTYYYEVPPT